MKPIALFLFAVAAWGQGNSAATPPVQAQNGVFSWE